MTIINVFLEHKRRLKDLRDARDEDLGSILRRANHLAQRDRMPGDVHLAFPAHVTDISPQFVSNLIGPSLDYHGGAEAFMKKYRFSGSPEVMDRIREYVAERAEAEALHERLVSAPPIHRPEHLAESRPVPRPHGAAPKPGDKLELRM